MNNTDDPSVCREMREYPCQTRNRFVHFLGVRTGSGLSGSFGIRRGCDRVKSASRGNAGQPSGLESGR